MVRIAGVNIPDKKKIDISLTSIYGIGRFSAKKILEDARVSANKRAQELDVKEVARLRDIIEKHYVIEGALRRKILMDIKHLKDTGTYRGLRHVKNLPVRGQRTRVNSRTRRGNVRRTMGSGRRALEKK